MDESPARPRRTTRQPPLTSAHPIGTPRCGLSTTTGALASAAWLADRGITPEDSRWSVEIELAVRGSDTRFVLEVYAEEWGCRFRHAGRTSWIRVTDIPFVHGQDEHALLARTPRLRDIAMLVRALERELDIRFDRDAAKIRTRIRDAEPALRAWVARL